MNGELASIQPDSTATFGTFDKSYIEIGSNDCEIDLYNVLLYNKTLSDKDILTNYFASNPVMSERIQAYNFNNVLTDGKRAGYDINSTSTYDPAKLGLIVNSNTMLDYNACSKLVPCLLIEGELPPSKGKKKNVGIRITKPNDSGGVTEHKFPN